MPKYCSVTVRGEQNKEAVERIETGHVALCCREMKWRGVRRGGSRRPKQDMCHRVEEDRRRSSDKHPLNLHVHKKKERKFHQTTSGAAAVSMKQHPWFSLPFLGRERQSERESPTLCHLASRKKKATTA